MRIVRLVGALALVSVSLSGCYAMDYLLFGEPGYYSDHHRGHKRDRHKRDRHDRDDRRGDRDRGDHRD